MGTEEICLGCMAEKGGAKVCPTCGYEEGTPPASPLHLKPGTVLNRKYLIGRVLGHGGFGITYLGLDLNLRVKLAIKEYFPTGLVTRDATAETVSVFSGDSRESFDYGLEKFLEEGRTLAKFSNVPEIVGVRDFLRENGTAYLVMDYIEGITLKEYLARQGGKLPLDAALTFVMPVVHALEKVHGAGMLHRDVSPDNIFVTSDFHVKLLDFGAARCAVGGQSRSLSVMLKPGYSPEEQYRSRGKQGPWTDVYATAATLYKLLTGETPPEAMDRLAEDDLKPFSSFGLSLPENYEKAILKALSVRAEGRYQSMAEFEAALTGEIEEAAEKTDPEAENPVPQNRKEPLGVTVPVSKSTPPGNGAEPAADVTVPLPKDKTAEAEDRPDDAPPAENRSKKSKFGLKKALIIAAAAVVLLVGSGAVLLRNVTESSLMAVQDGWMYYTTFHALTCPLDHYRPLTRTYALYKIRTDGSGKTKLLSDDVDNLKVAGNRIYYEAGDSEHLWNEKIYRIETDGTGKTRIGDDSAYESFCVVGDWIYYNNSSDSGKTYKIKTDGTGRMKLNDDIADGIQMSGDWIYYTNSECNLCKMKTDGSSETKLSNDKAGYYFCIADSWIYYINNKDQKLYKMKTDGTDQTKLGNDDANEIDVTGDWIYYTGNNDGELYKIKADGTGRAKLNTDGMGDIHIVNDWIYYVNYSDSRKLYKIKTDGTGRQCVN